MIKSSSEEVVEFPDTFGLLEFKMLMPAFQGDHSSNHRNRYLVPKSCVEWKTNTGQLNKAFYSNIRIEVPRKGLKGNLISIDFSLNNEIILLLYIPVNQKSQKAINSHNLLNQNFSLVSINPIRKEFGA